MGKHLTYIILLAALALLSAGCGPAGRPVKASDIIGSWSTVKNYDATEITFSLESDGTRLFNSQLRGRPYEAGIWELEGNDIFVFVNENNVYKFRDARIDGDTLSFSENGKRAVFKKIKDKDQLPFPAFYRCLIKEQAGLSPRLPVNKDAG